MVKIELTSFSHFQETKVVLKYLTNIFRTITCLHINLGSFNFEIFEITKMPMCVCGSIVIIGTCVVITKL